MPVRSNPFRYLSYITADGNEVVLSCEGYKKWWECYGREGFVAPKLKQVTREFADGTTETLAMIIKPRNLTVKMFVLGDSINERDEILQDMASRLVQIGTKKDWGKLKVLRMDGKYVYIDCVYAGGMDDIVDKYPTVQQFSLRFNSGSGYFYDIDETLLVAQNLTPMTYLAEDLYLSDDLYLTEGITSLTINNEGEEFYPVVDIFGPATVIRITNNTTGQTLGIDPTFRLQTNQKLTFNCREHERAITFTDADGDETDVTEEMLLGASLVWPIVKGTNRITFYYAESDGSTFARIRYRQRYLSA